MGGSSHDVLFFKPGHQCILLVSVDLSQRVRNESRCDTFAHSLLTTIQQTTLLQSSQLPAVLYAPIGNVGVSL